MSMECTSRRKTNNFQRIVNLCQKKVNKLKTHQVTSNWIKDEMEKIIKDT